MIQSQLDDFPSEILIRFFHFVDDTTLTSLRLVNKRFKELVEEAAAAKYDGIHEWYDIDGYSANFVHDMKYHRPFILKRIKAVKINFMARPVDERLWIFQMLERFCGKNLTMIKLRSMDFFELMNLMEILTRFSNLTHLYLDCLTLADSHWFEKTYSKLTNLYLKNVIVIQNQHLAKFFENNPQVQYVQMHGTRTKEKITSDVIDMSNVQCMDTDEDLISHLKLGTIKTGGLNVLKLRYVFSELHIVNLEKVLKIFLKENPNIETLYVYPEHYIAHVEGDIEFLSSYPKIKHLDTTPFGSSAFQIKTVIRSLPHLRSFKFTYTDVDVMENAISILLEANAHSDLKTISFVMFEEQYENIKNLYFYAWLIHNININVSFESHSSSSRTIAANGTVHADGIVFRQNDLQINENMLDWDQLMQDYEESPVWTPYNSHFDVFWKFHSIGIVRMNFEKLHELFNVRHHVELHNLYNVDESIRLKIENAVENYFRNELLEFQFYQKDLSPEALKIVEQFLECYGNFMKRAWVRRDRDYSPEILEMISKYCKSHLEELHLTERPHTTIELSFLKLTKLVFKNYIVSDHQWLRTIFCPKLKHLEIVGGFTYYVHSDSIQTKNNLPINTFNELTSIKIDRFDSNLISIFESFGPTENLSEFTLIGKESTRMSNELVNAIAKFRNLIELNLNIMGLENTNLKYLFENCSKLKRFTFFWDKPDDSAECLKKILKIIKRNCFEIESIQLTQRNGIDKLNQKIKEIFPTI